MEQPILYPRNSLNVDGRRRRTGSEGGALVTFLHHRVVPIPMQLHRLSIVAFLALTLIPYRWKIRRRRKLARMQLVHWKIEDHLRGIERIDTARPPFRLRIHKIKTPRKRQYAVAHNRDR